MMLLDDAGIEVSGKRHVVIEFTENAGNIDRVVKRVFERRLPIVRIANHQGVARRVFSQYTMRQPNEEYESED